MENNSTWQRRSGIMLCYPLEAKRIQKWNTPAVYTQPKLDGDRCRAIIRDRIPTLLSSEQNMIESVPHIIDEVYRLDLPDMELDGELYSHGMAHQNIHGIVSTKTHLHDRYEDVNYHVFDIVLNKPQVERMAILKTLFENVFHHCTYIERVPSYVVEANIDKIVEQMDLFHNEGYEGIIVRNPSGIYTRKRSVDIMKFKPRKEDAYVVIGYEEEISIHGEPKNALGALILQSDIGQVFKVGSGSYLTRKAREQLWEERHTLKGRIAQVAYQHLTTGHVPRFPVLMNLLSIQSPATVCASGADETTLNVKVTPAVTSVDHS